MKLSIALIIALGLSLTIAPSAFSKDSCGTQLPVIPDLSGFNRKVKQLLGSSSEGARIEYFYEDDILKYIRSVYFGETGKSVVFFSVSGTDSHSVILSDLNYATTNMDGRIGSAVTTQFFVCDGELITSFGGKTIQKHHIRAKKAWAEAILLEDEAVEAERSMTIDDNTPQTTRSGKAGCR